MEAVAQCALLVSYYAGYHPYHRVGNDGGSQFAACQYVVAHGDFPRHQVVPDSLVYALVVATENDEIAL